VIVSSTFSLNTQSLVRIKTGSIKLVGFRLQKMTLSA